MTLSPLFGSFPGPPPGPPPGSGKDEIARDRSRQVEARLDRAMLAMEAVWTLLRDRLGLTDAELVDRVVELDLTDGVLDGKRRRPPMQCPDCNRTIPRRFPRCLYCGADLQHDPFS